MNRQIKFRAWDKVKSKMQDNVGFSPWQENRYTGQEIYIGPANENYVLMQFTGLLDKNGKEIWEGDVVQQGVNKGAVEYRISNDNGYPINGWVAVWGGEWLNIWPETFEVIGNVYEHPNLLNV